VPSMTMRLVSATVASSRVSIIGGSPGVVPRPVRHTGS
jgi:hypothetical protein